MVLIQIPIVLKQNIAEMVQDQNFLENLFIYWTYFNYVSMILSSLDQLSNLQNCFYIVSSVKVLDQNGKSKELKIRKQKQGEKD